MTTTFFGVAIEGDIKKSRRTNVAQKSAEELHEALSVVLANDKVEAVRWYQYTPYFNDGDPCEFGTGEVSFKIAGMPDDAGEYDNGFVSSSAGRRDDRFQGLLGSKHRDWSQGGKWIVDAEPGDPALVAALQKFEDEFGGAYENVLLETFGDHAEVTAYRDKFVVDYYEHD